MDYNFSNDVKELLEFSTEESLKIGNNYISAEHFALSILRQNNSTALTILLRLGINKEQTVNLIKTYLKKEIVAVKQIQLTPEIIELEKKIEDIKNKKNQVVKNQRFDEAAALRDTEKKLAADLENAKNILRGDTTKEIIELEKKIEDIKNKKNQVVKNQRFDEAAALRDTEKKLAADLENAKKCLIRNYQLPLTALAEKVLKRAVEISTESKATTVKPEHLVLGILKEGNSYISSILNNQNITYNVFFQTLTRVSKGFESAELKTPLLDGIMNNNLSSHIEFSFTVFICKKSEDYFLAKPLYDFLVGKGISVFLSEESLPISGNSEYMKEIDKALESAQHMIVVSSNSENFCTTYVESEWRAFVNEKRSGRKKGNIITLKTASVNIHYLPLTLRQYEVFDYDKEKFEIVYKYLR